MLMNHKNLFLNAAILSMSSLVMAQTALTKSGNINYVSDYAWRGISQTAGGMAVQGGFDIEYGGFYLGTWSSNVDMAPATIEAEVYAGYAGSFTSFAKKLTYDVGLITYQYPGNNSGYDFNEIYGSLSMPVYGVTSTLGVNYSDDFFGGSGNATYYSLNFVSPTSMKNLSANATVGRQEIDNSTVYGTNDYTVYKLGVDYTMKTMTAGLQFSNTNSSADFSGPRTIVSLSSSF